MRIKNAGKMAAVAAVALAGVSAHAQNDSSMGLTFRVGYFYPAASSAREAGSNWFSYGADLRLRNLGHTNGIKTYLQLSGDLVQKGDFRSIPVTLTYVSEGAEFYYLAGAGVSFTELRNRDNELEDAVKFAYQVGIGYRIRAFSLPAYAEVKLMGTEESRLNGWGVFIGVRF